MSEARELEWDALVKRKEQNAIQVARVATLEAEIKKHATALTAAVRNFEKAGALLAAEIEGRQGSGAGRRSLQGARR